MTKKSTFGVLAGAGALILALGGPALAQSCQDELAAIDSALQGNASVEKPKLDEAVKLRDEAAALCQGGKDGEAMTKLDQVKQILGIG